MLQESLIHHGNTARLRQVLLKSIRSESITLGFIGGSITQGAVASSSDRCWAALVTHWWKTTVPQAQVEYVNAGIGATGSGIGAHRAFRDLLAHRPDFVVVEYAVNDIEYPHKAETLEGIVRQILSMDNSPAVMLLFTTLSDGTNVQNEHAAVGRHYDLPMVSFRDHVISRFQNGQLDVAQILPDGVHPSDQGHEIAALCVTHLLESVLTQAREDAVPPPIQALPNSLTSDIFQRTAMLTADDIQPVENVGWTSSESEPFGPGWECVSPGGMIEFDVEADTVSLIYHRIKGGMGRAQAWVDDLPPVTLEGWFEQDWGGYSHWSVIARDLGRGKHRLHIRLLEDNALESEGYRFQLQSILLAGVHNPVGRKMFR